MCEVLVVGLCNDDYVKNVRIPFWLLLFYYLHFKEIDYDKVHKIIEEKKKESYDFLEMELLILTKE